MDDLGNRDGSQTLRSGTVSYTVNDDTNRYTAIGTGSPAHDNAGNLTSDHRGYDYIYDYENRIIAIKNSSGGLVAGYSYDALGRRLGKWLGYDTIYYYYNANWQVLHEDSAFNADRQYVYGNYIDEMLLMDDSTNDHYYAHNHLFSTAALLDNTGSTVERYEYNAYGEVTIMDASYNTITASNHGNEYTYTGRRLDSLDNGNLKIMYYRARYYDSETGRFLQHDPVGIVPHAYLDSFDVLRQYYGGVNTYPYCNDNPLSHTDPSGRLALEGVVIAAIVTGCGVILVAVINHISVSNGCEPGKFETVESSYILGYNIKTLECPDDNCNEESRTYKEPVIQSCTITVKCYDRWWPTPNEWRVWSSTCPNTTRDPSWD